MYIKIIDWSAFLMSEEEIEKEKKERKINYWIKIKNWPVEDSFIIDKDKNKVRPILKDLINRMPKALEIWYLKIVLVSLLIIFLFILFIAAKSYDKQFLEANQKMDKIIEKIEKQNIKKTMENIPSNVSLSWSLLNYGTNGK